MKFELLFLLLMIILPACTPGIVDINAPELPSENLATMDTQEPVSEPTKKPTDTPLPSLTITDSPPSNTIVSSKDGMVMVYIQEGEFEMGSETGATDEIPVHTVYLDAFWMDQTEVTNGMYRECVEDNKCLPPVMPMTFNNDSYLDHPVIFVNWNDAQAYCSWAGRRLPTEAEWEKAARGDLIGKAYPWGNTTPVCSPGTRIGAQSGDCEGNTSRVKSFSPNGFGLYDMAGNVWEWVADWYQGNYYARSPSSNPLGPPVGDYRVLRGGSGTNGYRDLTVSTRHFAPPTDSFPSRGFRCAHSVVTLEALVYPPKELPAFSNLSP